MKRYLFIVFAFCCLAGVARGQGIQFEDIAFKEALAKAKSENKLVFVDCYTSWCGPCKRMAQNVFPTQEVGDYMNPKFVSLKCDMEKGEGPDLQKRYRVHSYPTFLIVNPEGEIVHKFVGATGPKTFVKNVGNAFDEKQAFGTYEKLYNEGNRDKDMLTDYATCLRNCSDPRLNEVIVELFSRLTDEERFSEKYRYIYQRVDFFPVGSEAWNFFVSRRDDFTRILGEEQVVRLLYLNYWDILRKIFSGDSENIPEKRLEEMEREFETLDLPEESYQIIHAYFCLAKVMHTDDVDKILTVCENEFPGLPRNRTPRGVMKLYKDRMTDAQQARWDALLEKLEKQES